MNKILVVSIGILALIELVHMKPDEDGAAQSDAEGDKGAELQTLILMKEIATGKRIDVSQHKNFQLLPTVQECGYPMKEDSLSNKPGMRIFLNRPTGQANLKYPWMVRIVVEDTKGIRSSTCAGTLITLRYVLTTASCLVGQNNGNKVSNVILGGHGNNCESGTCTPISKILEISETIIHPDFVWPTRQNDIGIIKLTKDVPAENLIRPVCLPQSETLLSNWKNNKTLVVGWSKIDDGSLTTHMLYPRTLHSMEMTLELRNYCDRFYKRSHDKFGPGRFCASGDANKATCTDDDGGPALKSISVPDLEQQRFYQFGIVSFRHKLCGQPGIPSGFTNVLNYMHWILDNLSVL